MHWRRFIVIALLFCLSSLPLAAASWLHVRVESDNEEQVKVNIPLSLVSTVLPILERQAPEHMSRHGVHWDEHEISVAEMREIWEQLKAEGSYDLATIQSPEANVAVRIDGDYLRVDTEEGSKERVQVRVPVRVVDALLAGSGEELNLVAALEALRAEPEQELVSVDAEDARVRVWIDENNQ